jgi:lipopolysaccharide heptosyltransferase II
VKPAPKFLIIRFSSIGDVILATPLVRCLRAAYPESRIDFLVKKEFAAVLSGNPYLNEILILDKQKGPEELSRIRKKIRETGYTRILDIQMNIRSVALTTFSGVSVSCFSKKIVSRDLLIRFGWNTYSGVKPVFLRYFEAAESDGVSYDGKGTEVFPSDAHRVKVKELLVREGIPEGIPLLVLAPGAQWENKRWPADRFAAAADQFCRETGGRVALAGGAGDREICERVISLMKTRPADFCGKLDLMGSAALLGFASVALTNDTGMMHMAQAVKTPVVAVFGPTTRELGFFPVPEKSRVAEAPVSCRPCTQKGLHHCPQKHFLCMNDIYPETVASHILNLYNESHTD